MSTVSLLLLTLFFGIAYSQVSVAFYTDSSCTKMSSSTYYPPACTPSVLSNTKAQCNSDKKSVISSTWGSSNTECSGTPNLSVTLYSTVGSCTRLSDYVYYIATCGATLPTSNVVVSRKTWIASGCSSTPFSVSYGYRGCWQTSSTTWSSGECSGSTATTRTYSDSSCSTVTRTTTDDSIGTCLLKTSQSFCGFQNSAFTATLSILTFFLMLSLYF